MAQIVVDPQPTPNPNAMKFNVNVTVVDGGSKSFNSKDAAAESPLAAALFALNGVANVFMLGNFITVNKEPSSSWNDLVPEITEIIETHLAG